MSYHAAVRWLSLTAALSAEKVPESRTLKVLWEEKQNRSHVYCWCDCTNEWTANWTTSQEPICAWNVQLAGDFHEKVAVSFEPTGVHYLAHTISWSRHLTPCLVSFQGHLKTSKQLRVKYTRLNLSSLAMWIMHPVMLDDSLHAEQFKPSSSLDLNLHTETCSEDVGSLWIYLHIWTNILNLSFKLSQENHHRISTSGTKPQCNGQKTCRGH